MPEHDVGTPPAEVQTLAEDQQSIDTAAAAYAEANRILELKARYFDSDNRIRCYTCDHLVDLDTGCCAHCGADNTDHLDRVRQDLARLDEIAAQLYSRHEENLEHYRREVAKRPLWQKIRALLEDRRLWMDLEVIVPSFLVFFALVIMVRIMGHGALFWTVTILGGVVARFLLSKSQIRRRVLVDVYRTWLGIGLLLVVSSAVYRPMEMWPRVSSGRVEVTRPVANLREAATTESAIVLETHRGEKFTILDREGAWYKVRTDTGEEGWVHSALVSDVE